FFLFGLLALQPLQGQLLSEAIPAVFAKEKTVSRLFAQRVMSRYRSHFVPAGTDVLDSGVTRHHYTYKGTEGSHPLLVLGQSYRLELFTRNDTLFMTAIYQNRKPDSLYRMLCERVYQLIDTAQALQYIGQHNRRFGAALTLMDLSQEPSLFRVYGAFCGFAGAPTPGAQALAGLVENRDLPALLKLAASFFPVERAYGTAGLYLLHRGGTSLPEVAWSLIRLNRQSGMVIPSCDGCIYGDASLRELLDEHPLRYLFLRFQASGLLQKNE
ncbi:MAG TPA: hypothetical protein VHK69_01515, partial [Chitinophagaceae bacterium]|nr:hypothetical protein [Chitinophagaceae bacterium]